MANPNLTASLPKVLPRELRRFHSGLFGASSSNPWTAVRKQELRVDSFTFVVPLSLLPPEFSREIARSFWVFDFLIILI